MVSLLFPTPIYIFPLYHDERDVYENTLEITVSDLRVVDDTLWLFLISNLLQYLHQIFSDPVLTLRKRPIGFCATN